MSKLITFFLFLSFILTSCTAQINLSETPIGLINDISYKDAQYSNSNAGNGFLVSYKKQTYAITAKHILMIAKTPKMKFIDFEGELKEWKMYPKDDNSKLVILDELLNSSKKELLNWESMSNDWLVFSVKKNNSNHQPLKLREQPLVADEKLFIIGWSYKDEVGSQRVYEYKYARTDGDFYEMIQVNGPKSLGGLSGAPVVDEHGNVVGLVSSSWEDEKTKETVVAATSTKNIISFLNSLNDIN
ncbi:MAG: serine protease [Saprospiraceae bacterium]